jgi:hypothetical protein
MNLPGIVAGKMASAVESLIFERMTDIEVRFAGNGGDGRLIERQLLGRASVEMEGRTDVQRSMPHRPLYSIVPFTSTTTVEFGE